MEDGVLWEGTMPGPERPALELTGEERLGLESGYHRNFIGLVERGQLSATIGALFRLARVLQVRPSFWLAWSRRRAASHRR